MNNTMLITIGAGIFIILISMISQLRSELLRMRTILDKIAKEVGVPDLVTDEIKEELKGLIKDGKSVEAIKRYRKLTGFGLKEAKEYIDKLSDV
ncbi:MAG: 50S ribosomal protein L7/L12 [Clostridium chrysemydis]|uniref:50S ribosomal protein L7/L12 n=1 Tax=Clostridium chrysemydis TaxID=2665504 RepID=UPI003F39BD5D